jgi:hypothetical protein
MRLAGVRITLWGLMIAVAISAVLINRFRPITEADAIRIAIAYTKRTQPEYRLEALRANAYWIQRLRYYVILWDNPADEMDIRLPYDLMVNHDGRCTEFTGEVNTHYEEGTKRRILDRYAPLSTTPFVNIPFRSN